LIASAADLPTGKTLSEFVGIAQFTGEFSDTWVGVSYARALGDHFGVGVTWYGAFRSQQRRAETIGQGIATDGTGLSTLDLRGGRYSSIRTLAKIGTSFVGGPFTAGLTLTTPSLHIGGSGELGFNTGVFGTDTTALAATLQPNLPAEFKSPLSIGGGAAFRLGNTRLFASGEWFQAVDPYFVMQGEDFVAQQPPDTFSVDAVQAMDEVLNWAVGVQHAFSPRFSAYVSYLADNSGLTNNVQRASLSILPIDISTVTAGADFRVSLLRFTLGFGYGWGSRVDQNLTDLLQQQDPDFEATYVYRSMRFVFGFEIGGKE
jgi:hypothetical protein